MSRLAMGIAAAIAALTGIAATFDAHATRVTRFSFSHGPAFCQTALPVFDGNIRKRPMGISNEGTGVAFITCDPAVADDIEFANVAYVRLDVLNRGTTSAIVSCTLVDGLGVSQPPVAYPKSTISLAPGITGGLTWLPAVDNNNLNFVRPALSCGLPPGVELNTLEIAYTEDIGA